MDIMRRSKLQQVVNCDTTDEMITIIKANRAIFKDIQIILFNEGASNFEKFNKKTYGKYHLCSIGDYNKTWILDCNNLDIINLNVARKIYFDINIISRINKLICGRKIDDQNDFDVSMI